MQGLDNLMRALERTLQEQEQQLRREVAAEITEVASRSGDGIAGTALSLSLHVLMLEQDRAVARALLEKLERALRTLQDLALNDAQNEIANEILFPAIDELKQLVGAVGSTSDEAIESRGRAFFKLGNVVETAKTLAIVSTAAREVAGDAPAAAGAVIRGGGRPPSNWRGIVAGARAPSAYLISP